MLKHKKNPALIAVMAVGGALFGMLLYGCQSDQNSSAPPSSASTTQPIRFALFGPPPEKTGAQLWVENCGRCHNLRPPDEFSAAQWDAIVHHMRLRANLTGEEQRKIAAFLEASH